MFCGNIPGDNVGVTCKLDGFTGLQVNERDQHVIAGIELEDSGGHGDSKLPRNQATPK